MAAPRRAAFAEERAEVEVLFANVEKMGSLAKKIHGSKNRLDTSGNTIHHSVGPLMGNTSRLHAMNRNVDRTLKIIDLSRAPLSEQGSEEQTLRQDPDVVGISRYIAAMEKEEQLLSRLQLSKLGANQAAIKERSALIKYGTRVLEDKFKQRLNNVNAGPIEPLGYVMKDNPFPRMPRQTAAELQPIALYMSRSASRNGPPNQEAGTSRLYADIRGRFIERSLSTLAEGTKGIFRKQESEALYKRQDCGIEAYAKGLAGMIQAEHENIRSIFPREETGRVLLSTTRYAMNDFEKTLSDLSVFIKARLMTECFLAFETIEVVNTMTAKVAPLAPELKQPLTNLLGTIRTTARAALPKFVEDTRSRVQSISVLSPEGGATQVTVDIMRRLCALPEFLPVVEVLLVSLGDGGWNTVASPTSTGPPSMRSFETTAKSNEKQQLFIGFCIDILDNLVQCLDSRARLLLKSQGVQAVFMLNNLAVIEGIIKDSELSQYLGPVKPKMDTWRSKHVKLYTNAWQPAIQNLFDVQKTNRQSRPGSSGQMDSATVIRNMNSKERDNIKEKFRGFNTSFDDLVQKHKSYKTEPAVRQELSRELERLILPLYDRFWDRYHDVDKGRNKYVKYDKQSINQIISSL